jgi:hypothetical protein
MSRSPAVGSGPLTRLLPTLGLVAILALAAGCGGRATPSATGVGAPADPTPSKVVRAPTLLPGQPIPAPTGKPVLTLTGKISATNKGSAIVFDQATIDRLGQVQITVYEPWVKQDMTFRGVWLADLLTVADASTTASSLRMTALDDYRAEVTMTAVRAGGMLLATRAGDGSAIPVADGGPTRLVYVNGIKSGANADLWIWSLKTIEVR